MKLYKWETENSAYLLLEGDLEGVLVVLGGDFLGEAGRCLLWGVDGLGVPLSTGVGGVTEVGGIASGEGRC